MGKLTITITATVDADEFETYRKEHKDMADVADSFDARLSEVYGSGPEILTTVQVQKVEIIDAEGEHGRTYVTPEEAEEIRKLRGQP